MAATTVSPCLIRTFPVGPEQAFAAALEAAQGLDAAVSMADPRAGYLLVGGRVALSVTDNAVGGVSVLIHWEGLRSGARGRLSRSLLAALGDVLARRGAGRVG